MKKLLLIPLLLMLSCSDSESPEPSTPDPKPDPPKQEEPKPIEITDIEQSHSPVAAGQSVELSAVISDAPSDIAYLWNASFDGANIGSKETPDVTLNTEDPGDYIINVKVASGDRSGEFTKSISVIPPDFGVGAWGNSSDIIVETETNTRLDVLMGFYWPYEGNSKPTKSINYQTGTYETISYLFNEDKLSAGNIFVTLNPVSYPSGIERNHAYAMYLEKVNNVNSLMGQEGIESQTWSIPEDMREGYLNWEPPMDGIGMAVTQGHLEISTTWDNAKSILKDGTGNNIQIMIVITK